MSATARMARMLDATAPTIAPLSRVTTAPRPLDDRLWSILAKPAGQMTAEDWAYLEQREREGAA